MSNEQLWGETEMTTCIAAMLRMARVDGVRDEEMELIAAFHAESPLTIPLDQMPDFWVIAGPILETVFKTEEKKRTVLTSCVMVAYADGNLSAAEWAELVKIAEALAMPQAMLDEVHAQVRNALIQSLAKLPDSESVAAVAKELK